MHTTSTWCRSPDAWLRREPAPPCRHRKVRLKVRLKVRRDHGRRHDVPVSTAAVAVLAPLIASLLLTLTSCTVNIYWHVVTSPNEGSGGSALTRLTAVAATNIWAVGSYTPTSGSPGQT